MPSFDAHHWARALAGFFVAHIILIAPLALSAQTTSTWQVPGIGSWNDPANWDLGVPMVAGDHAIFGPAFPTVDATVIVIDPTTTVGMLTLNNPFQLDLLAPTLTLDGNGSPALIEVLDGQLMFQSGSFVLASDLDLSVAPGLTAVVGAEISPAASLTGPGGLNILGGGTVTLNGANSYGGATHISSGLLRVLNNNSLGTGTGVDLDGTFIHTGGTLEIASNNVSLPNEKITVDGGTLTGGGWKLGGPVQLNDGLITGNSWIITGPLTASGGSLSGNQWRVQGPITLTDELTAAGGLGLIEASISGSGGLRVDAPGGELRLTRASSYTGITTIRDGKLLVLHNLALGAGTGVDADGTVVHADGTLIIGFGRQIANEKITLLGGVLEGSTIQLDAPIVSDGGTLSANTVVVNGGVELIGDLTINGGTDGTINGNISGPGGLIVIGGQMTLFGSNTYSGQTVIGAGAEVTTMAPDALGSGSGTDADATFVQAGGSLLIGGGSSGAILTEKIILDGGTLVAGKTSGPVELRSDSTIFTIHLNGVVSGSGALTVVSSDTFATKLNNTNTYTGQTRLVTGLMEVNNPYSLGSTDGGTLVSGGDLYMFVSSQEPIEVDGGALHIHAADYAGPISIGTGIVDNNDFNFTGINISIASPINLTGGTATLRGRESMVLEQGTSGHGVLKFDSQTFTMQFQIDAPLAHHGDVVVRRGDVNLNTQFDLDGTWVLDRSFGTWFVPGALIVNVDMTGRLKMIGGRLTTADGVAFTHLDPILNMRGGSIDGDLLGVTRIVKTSFRNGWFDDIGAANDADIDLQRGRLIIANSRGLGTTAGTTTVAPRDAALVLRSPDPIAESIHLNNATGLSFSGGLVVQNNTTLTAPLHLGDVGSIIEVENRGRLFLQAPVMGGGLRFRGGGGSDQSELIMTAPDNALTGVVNIGADNRRGRLSLRDNGRLIAAIRVEIPAHGTLRLDNQGTANLPDRLDDQIPVWLWGGELELASAIGAFASERVGHVDAQFGASTIRAIAGNSVANRTELTIGQLDRRAGTIVDFEGEFADANAPQPGKSIIQLDTPPTLVNGLIGGWATVNQTDFATYGTHGVAAFTAYETDLNAAGTSDNVSINTPTTLTSDSDVNSLRLGFTGSLDLGGNTLNLASGGLIQLPFDTTIDNGTLTAGATSPGELAIHNDNAILDISADITDNGIESVGLLVSGGNLFLRGNNTYSGPTSVTSGIVRLFTDTALPAGTDITVSGGSLTSEFTSDTTLTVGDVVIRDSGGLSVINLDANSYTLESGSLSGIIGDGPVLKTTPGSAWLSFDDRYTGDVTILMGMIRTRSGLTTTTGSFTVLPQGELRIFDRKTNIGSDLTLAGGVLSFLGGTNPQATYSGPISVTVDSDVHVSDDALISGEITGDGNLTFWDVDVEDSHPSVTFIRGDNGSFTGDIDLRSGILVPQSETALGQGSITVREFGQIWAGSAMVRGRIILDGGHLATEEFFFKGPASSFADPVVVSSDSHIGRTYEITLLDGLVLRDDVTLTKSGTSTLNVEGVLGVGHGTTLFGNEGLTRIIGTITADADEATLDLVRADRTELAAGIHVDAGRNLTITENLIPMPLIVSGLANSVTGGGTLGNDLVLGSGATMMPGASAGVFTVDGDYTQLVDAILLIELGGTAAGLHDRLIVTGMLDAGGILELLLIDGFVPGFGDAFDVLDFGTAVPGSAFDQFLLPQLGPGLAWDTHDLLVTGEIRVVPEPMSLGLLGLGGITLIQRRR